MSPRALGSASPARRGPGLLLRGALLAALAGCGGLGGEPVEEVVLRLGPAAFQGLPAARHGPVAKVGEEARAVVLAPAEVVVAESFGVVPGEGAVTIDVGLPEPVRRLPPSAFQLSVQQLPFTAALPEAARLEVAERAPAVRLGSGWRLRREAAQPEKARLEVDPRAEWRQAQLNLRLSALLPVPAALASHPFDLPAAGRLALGFGLVNAAAAEARPVRFRARLTCAGGAERVLVDRTLDPGEPQAAAWQEASPAVAAATGCRLDLTAESEGGAPPLGAVWAVPQLLAPAADTRSVVLVSMDTLRADHLSSYGYARPTTPAIDAQLAAPGTLFLDAMTTYPRTDVAHMSLFTGLYPQAQPAPGRVAVADPITMLTEALQRKGLETVAFTEDGLLGGAFGFWFGFDRFTERPFMAEETGRATFEEGIRYLRAHRRQRFFLFLHTFKVHGPYVVSEAYEELWNEPGQWTGGGPDAWVSERFRDHADRYDRALREADDLVGRLLATLDETGLARRTLVVLLADHGEAFGEHGTLGHGATAYQETLHIPLILRGPGVPAGGRVPGPVSLVDVAPTILDLLGAPPLDQAQGQSLVPALRGEALPADRPLFFSSHRDGGEGVRYGSWKYVRTPRGHELFDLARDPHEEKPIGRGEPPREADEALLRAHAADSAARRRQLAAGPAPGPEPAISEETERALRALGYL